MTIAAGARDTAASWSGWLPALFALAAVLALAMGWVGFLGSDDRTYAEAAEGWLRDGLFVPKSHFAVRHTVTLPIAASFALFGPGEWQAALPMALYAGAIAAVLYASTAVAFGRLAGGLALALFVFLPLTGESASVANCDFPELLFALVSLAFYVRARGRYTAATALLAGACAGLAFLSRETTSSLLVFYGILFLFSPGMPRGGYFVMAAGFLGVIAAEMLYYLVAAGDPLLRFRIVLEAATLPNPANVGGFDGSVGGNPLNSRVFGPFLAVLVNSEFGLLFWALIPAAIGLRRARARLSPFQRELLVGAALLAVTWLIWSSYALTLRPLPRYYWVCAVAAVLIVAVWLALVVRPVWLRWLLVAGHALLGLLLIDLTNQQPTIAEHMIVGIARTGAVYTDPKTAAQAKPLLRWSGLPEENVIGAPPPPGALYVLNRKNLDRWAAENRIDAKHAGYRPRPGWRVERTELGRPTLLGRALIASGLSGAVTRAGGRRLIWEAQPTPVYRVGGQP